MNLAQHLYDKYQPMYDELMHLDDIYKYKVMIENEKPLTDKMFRYGQSVLKNRVELALNIINIYNIIYLITIALRYFLLDTWESELISAVIQLSLFGGYMYVWYEKKRFDKVKEQFEEL